MARRFTSYAWRRAVLRRLRDPAFRLPIASWRILNRFIRYQRRAYDRRRRRQPAYGLRRYWYVVHSLAGSGRLHSAKEGRLLYRVWLDGAREKKPKEAWQPFASTARWSIRPEIAFGIRWRLGLYGAKVRRLPTGKVYRNAVMIYLLIAGYKKADWVIGWAVLEEEHERWLVGTWSQWLAFVDNTLIPSATEAIAELHPEWSIRDIVLWHFIPHRYK